MNFTQGDSGIARYFNQQFGFSHASGSGFSAGFLITRGKELGYKSTLVECPMPANKAAIGANKYSEKMINAVLNLLVSEAQYFLQ